MHRKNIFSTLVLALFLTSCTADSLVSTSNSPASDDGISAKIAEEATSAMNVQIPLHLVEPALAKGANREADQLIFELYDLPDGPFFVPCMNGGEGEDAVFLGDLRYVADIVTTPNGDQHWSGTLEEWDIELTGQTTGDVWLGEGIAHVIEKYRTDGTYQANESLHELYENQATGQRMRMLSSFRSGRNSDELVFEIVSCALVGPKNK